MTFKLGSLIKEQASSSGLADFTLAGAVQNFRPFSSLLTANGDTTWYFARNGAEFEAGLGTRTGVSGLARTTVLESSSAGNAKVTFSAPPIIYCDVPASQISAASPPPESWHYIGDAGEPAFQNSFVNFDANHRAAYYLRDSRVYLKGLIKGGALNQAAFTLPVGYRPDQEIRFATTCNAAFGSLYVGTNGNVQFEAGALASWASIDTISFRVA